MPETLKGIDNVANKGLWLGGGVAILGIAAFPPLILPGVIVAGTSGSWLVGRQLSDSKKSK